VAHVIVFRHGATYPDQADTDPLNVQNIQQQRQLSEQGRAVAKSIGDSIRLLKIPVSEVRTSASKRAADTGALMGFGDPKMTLDLTEGGLVVSPNENNRRAKALRDIAATAPAAGSNSVVVTHKPNLMDAFGKEWFDIREAEASIFKPEATGGSRLIARVRAEEWGKLAERPNE
jgi:phosphohistidine phosphatase SixA